MDCLKEDFMIRVPVFDTSMNSRNTSEVLVLPALIQKCSEKSQTYQIEGYLSQKLILYNAYQPGDVNHVARFSTSSILRNSKFSAKHHYKNYSRSNWPLIVIKIKYIETLQ